MDIIFYSPALSCWLAERGSPLRRPTATFKETALYTLGSGASKLIAAVMEPGRSPSLQFSVPNDAASVGGSPSRQAARGRARPTASDMRASLAESPSWKVCTCIIIFK